MKLSAFRIKNFRSIIDTGWQNLSPDNITCLIGQNESGKTSILEGLKDFYTGTISEDVLRSDLSMPEISCRFSMPSGWLLKITDNPGTELRELLAGLDNFELTRYWIEDFSSVIKASGAISHYLDSLEDAWILYLNEVKEKLEGQIKLTNSLEADLDILMVEKADINEKLAKETNTGWIWPFRKKADGKSPVNESLHSALKKQSNEIKKKEEEIKAELSGLLNLKKAGGSYLISKENLDNIDRRLSEISVKLEDRHQKMTLLLKPSDDFDDIEWKRVLEDYRTTKSERETASAELAGIIAFCGYLMEGDSEEAAQRRVDEIKQTYKSKFTSEMLGIKYFEYIPVFEMFEDFGSLLPNRIDMEDIIRGNEHVEGYKAARNFLTIASLDYSFFQQSSSRILKQKIENLNQSLTVNFQDFWQQSIGRNNKIRIQFELEHYNATYGEKAGKPYLEFWIKDEGERLYPKQRSRGVRWFLSFYMELKASAVMNNKHRVLLVDEPGVSLHARAQEDVLKVFEDIKDKIQILYTTHSPHLVEITKLHRVLAVQRDDLDSLRSTTRIIDPLSLSAASPDTLTPLQSIMGNPMASEGFSAKKFNLIVNDTGTFYVLSAIIHLAGYKGKINVIPSTNVSAIPLICNILLGWGKKFAVLLFENEDENKIADYLIKTIFKTENDSTDLILKMPKQFLNSEDLLSTLDFKNHVLNSREGITVQNSVYLKEKEIPRNFVLSRFLNNVKSGLIKITDFDEETFENFNQFTSLIKWLK
jgi:ABC-type ATPase involved in cell division